MNMMNGGGFNMMNSMNMMNMMNMMNNNMTNSGQNIPKPNPGQNNPMTNSNNQPEETIKRGDKTMNIDAYPGQQKFNRINILMAASSGLKILMPTPCNTPIREHIRKYLEKVGLHENILSQNILIFLINAAKIDYNSYAPIQSVCKGNPAVVTVVDLKYVIAA